MLTILENKKKTFSSHTLNEILPKNYYHFGLKLGVVKSYIKYCVKACQNFRMPRILKHNINRNLLIKIFLFVLYYSMVMYFGATVLMNKVMY